MTEMEKRIFVDAYENTRRNKEYKMYEDRIVKLGYKIKKHLGLYWPLFLEYEELVGLSEGIFVENVYRIGIQDRKKLVISRFHRNFTKTM